MALRWASTELMGVREIILTAVSHSWEAIAWASDELRADREIILKVFGSFSQGWCGRGRSETSLFCVHSQQQLS